MLTILLIASIAQFVVSLIGLLVDPRIVVGMPLWLAYPKAEALQVTILCQARLFSPPLLTVHAPEDVPRNHPLAIVAISPTSSQNRKCWHIHRNHPLAIVAISPTAVCICPNGPFTLEET